MSDQMQVHQGKVEGAVNEMKGYIEKLDKMKPDIAALKKAYEKDPAKKAVVDNVEKFVNDLYSTGSMVFDGDEKKLIGNLNAIYKNIPALKKNLEAIEGMLGEDLKYGKNKMKRGDISKYTKKIIKALGKYLKGVLTPQTVAAMDATYSNNLNGIKEDYKGFKNMVKDYVGSKVVFSV